MMVDEPGEGTENQATIVTVSDRLAPDRAGIVDAHNHVWIAPPRGAVHSPFRLDNPEAIRAELVDFRNAGGGAVLDFQPAGCGRDGRKLADLSRASRVPIVACTGYHRRPYYPADHWLWQAGSDQAGDFFVSELRDGLEESRDLAQPVHPGFIKMACEAEIEASPLALMEAAAAACCQTGLALALHTEKGLAAEDFVGWLGQRGVEAGRIVLCHMDKRPDFGLHSELARAGVLLEYDTFYRPQYDPERNVWPLLETMVAAGWDESIAIGTDMADPAMWSRLGGEPGLAGLPQQILPRMQRLGLAETSIRRLGGANIARRLAVSAL